MAKLGEIPALLALLPILVLSGRPASGQNPTQSEASTIAAPQIGPEAMQLSQRLRNLPDKLLSAASLEELQQRTNRIAEETTGKARQTESEIPTAAISQLQQFLLDWNNLKKEIANLSQTLTKHATALEQETESLKDDESLWAATNKSVKAQKRHSELTSLTEKAVTDIRTSLASLDEQRGQITTLQQRISMQGSIVATEIAVLMKALEASQRSLLEADSPPLWKVQFRAHPENELRRPRQETYSEDLQRLRGFLRDHRKGLAAALALSLIVLVVITQWKRTSANAHAESATANDTSITQRPISLALLVLLVAMLPLLYDAPSIAISVVHLLGMIPVVRLLKPRLTAISQRQLMAVIVSVPAWYILKILPLSFWLKRDLFAAFALVITGTFIVLARASRRGDQNLQSTPLMLLATSAGIVLVVLAFFANVLGYTGLSNLLTQGTLSSAYRATVYYTLAVVGGLFLSFVFQERRTQTPAAAHSDRGRVARRLIFALKVTLVLLWLHTTLNLFAVRGGVYAAIGEALNYPIPIGSFTFAARDIVAFILTLAIGYLVASITRVVLGEGVLPRLNLSYGLSNAVATVSHYVILVLVFLLAAAAAGVEFSKFALLTGALGVGLGFGLQNVVNNFVSGLILLFERPVRPGDFVEIGGVGGQVRKIGVRSSTLRAADGSALIVPNANLISERVVNWTLNDTRRQILLNIPVAYGIDPNEVYALLSTTVEGHREVLRFPAPQVFFMGFANSALNFEIRFWAPHPEAVPKLRSEVALRIAGALNKAGITLPMPQRIPPADHSDVKSA